MTTIYVDPSSAVAGNGTADSPYRSMSEVVAAGVTHPVTIAIKRGTKFVWSYRDLTTASIFCNQSDTQSVLTSYGEGAYPVWISKDSATEHCNAIYQNMEIHGIQLSPPPGKPFTASGYMVGSPRGNPLTGECNLNIHDLDFIGDPASVSGSSGRLEVTCIKLLADKLGSSNIAHKILIQNIRGDHVNCGIFVRGNLFLSDTSTYLGDQKKSYGVRVLDASFTNIINYGVLLAGTASKNKSRDVRNDEWESGWDNIYYSSYRTNVYDPTTDPFAWATARADVPLWMTFCTHTTGQNFEVHGSGPAAPDRYAVDIDWHCNNCLIRWGYTSNNAKSLMFIQGNFASSWYAGNGYTAPSSDPYTLYHDYGVGNRDNVIEYVLSFNDGVARTQRTADIYWKKACCFRYCYNNVVRNCLFIDTVSQANDHVLYCNPQADDNASAISMTLDSCIFYWRFRNNSDLISAAHVAAFGSLLAKFEFKNSIFFSEAWSAGATAALPDARTSGLHYVDPKFANPVPLVPPSGLKEAMNILKLSAGSPALNVGTVNAAVDLWGKAGNNIGWQQ
ncbi:hypothetical protein ACCY16_02220 [Candidatus Pantoea formicae]|uniref:hypothetical protein n=1 Tax=Candidatus Pantoea formicae TaxID=2608355 RepID=UPI003ED93937